MIIQFSVKNYKSFKDRATFSFIASNYDKDTREEDNVFLDSKFNNRILKSAVIYGANASGKSKFIDALAFMKSFVINSSKDTQKGDAIPVEAFMLNSDTESEPSEFEIIFLYKNILYRYGFETTSEKIVSEWLYYKSNVKEIELFYREFQDFDTHNRSFSKGKTLIKEKLIRNNSLMISVGAQFNEKKSSAILEWFKSIGTISGDNISGYQSFTLKKTDDKDFKLKILNLLKSADFGIKDINLEMLDLNALPKDMPSELKEYIIKKSKEEDTKFLSDILTSRKKYNNKKELIGYSTFSLDDEESLGTRKFFALTGPILDSLENGTALIIDELDSKLHPNLVCKIVSLFNSKNINTKNAQLLFNTHNTNLLSSGLFRKDQVWFTKKDRLGEAILYSLSDFKSEKVRKDEAFEDNYLRGKYGAIPYLGNFDELI